MDTKGRKGGRLNWEIGLDVYTLVILCVKQITNENLQYSTGNPAQCSGDKNEKEVQTRGDTCIHRADSLLCTAETNTIL